MPLASLRRLRTPSGAKEVPSRLGPRVPRRQRHPCHQGSTPERPARGPGSLRKWIKDCGRPSHCSSWQGRASQTILKVASEGLPHHSGKHLALTASHDPPTRPTLYEATAHRERAQSNQLRAGSPGPCTSNVAASPNTAVKTPPSPRGLRLGRSLGASHGTTPKHGAPKVS